MIHKGRGRILDIVAGLLVLIASISIVGYAAYSRVIPARDVGDQVIYIKARRWSFEPNKISVAADMEILFIIESIDVTHGFTITNKNISLILIPGKPVKVWIKFDKPGIYEFRCNIYCGEPWRGSGIGHWFMKGIINVTKSN